MKIYRVCRKSTEENFTEEDAIPSELQKGMKVEKEHTNDDQEAKKIALDHLAEIKDYYTRLIEMEDEAKSDQE